MNKLAAAKHLILYKFCPNSDLKLGGLLRKTALIPVRIQLKTCNRCSQQNIKFKDC